MARQAQEPADLAQPAGTSGSPSGERLLIVSPVRNEAAHIERVAHAVAAQTRPPDLWLVADDSSDDGTLEILRDLEGQIPFMQVVCVPPFEQVGKDRLAMALPPRAFNRALAQVDHTSFTHLGKLDGDIELAPEYFEKMLARMRADPQLGITGGSLMEPTGPGGSWKPIVGSREHVHGALKLYSRDCFEALGGVQERLGWDSIDETYARMRGFRTESDREVVSRHHRPTGSADGRLRGRMRHGACAYISRQSLPWVLGRSVKVGAQWQPRGASGVAFAWGYVRCAIRRSERVDDEEYRRFVRAEHRRRMRRMLSVG